MRISDWSSDVCSSDLRCRSRGFVRERGRKDNRCVRGLRACPLSGWERARQPATARGGETYGRLTAGGRNDGRRARARRRQGQDQARGAAVLRVAFLRVVARLAVFVALAAFAGAFFFAAVSLRTADLRTVALRATVLRAGGPPWRRSSAVSSSTRSLRSARSSDRKSTRLNSSH